MPFPEPKESHGNHPEGTVLFGAFLVAGGEGTELFAAGDGVLDPMTQPVDRTVEGAAAVLVATVGDGVGDAVTAAQRSDGAAAVALVAHDSLGADTGATPSDAADGALHEQPEEDRRLVALPRREHHGQWLAATLRLEVDLGREAPLAPAEGLGFWVPPFAPAACWCARITVPSTNCTSQSTWPAASTSRWTAAKSRSHTPASRQRRNRVYTLCHGPYRSGRSRHGAPVPSRQRMPFTTGRCALLARPVRGCSGGSNGARRAHSSSVTSCRRTIPKPTGFEDTP